MDIEEFNKDKQYCFVQKQLEKYQQERILERPSTKKSSVVVLSCCFVIFLSLLILCLVFFKQISYITITIPFVIFVYCDVYLRFLGIQIVKCYQHYASDETRRRCLCIPSCSEYSIICFKKYLLIIALLKIRKRLYVTCTGDEYKIDIP